MSGTDGVVGFYQSRSTSDSEQQRVELKPTSTHTSTQGGSNPCSESSQSARECISQPTQRSYLSADHVASLAPTKTKIADIGTNNGLF